jgi:exodeoxyribonuclease V alpha subunit
VEAGSVLGDICDEQGLDVFSASMVRRIHELGQSDFVPRAGRVSDTGLEDCIVRLNRTFRFSETSGIGALGEAVNQGQSEKCIDLLAHPPDGSIGFLNSGSPESFFRSLESRIIEGFRPMVDAPGPLEALQAVNRFRILCAVRSGPFGVQAVNAMVEDMLDRRGLIRSEDPWRRGRPVLITRNDYASGLYNGDLGVAFPKSPSSGPSVVFADSSGGLRWFSPARLPDHETAYAMTVHKSQGSEFDSVVLLLPETDTALLTRELVYTGITRARHCVWIGSDPAVLRSAVSRKMRRASGLHDALWKTTA